MARQSFSKIPPSAFTPLLKYSECLPTARREENPYSLASGSAPTYIWKLNFISPPVPSPCSSHSLLVIQEISPQLSCLSSPLLLYDRTGLGSFWSTCTLTPTSCDRFLLRTPTPSRGTPHLLVMDLVSHCDTIYLLKSCPFSSIKPEGP